MQITIVGAGNVGTQIAVHCAEKGHDVTIYTSKPNQIQAYLTIVNEYDQVVHQGIIKSATNSPKVAFENAEVIFVAVPAYCMDMMAEKILPFARKDLKIGIFPGTGGGEFAFKKCIESGATVFGLQRVPSVARLVEYGKTVRAIGYRDELNVAAIPQGANYKCAELVSSIFEIRTKALPCYLAITLTPSNPILHTTRLKNIFEDYKSGMVYETQSLFYEDWNDETSRVLLECDDEVQHICRALEEFDLSDVKSLRIHYESPTKELLTEKIMSIKGFKGLRTPMIPFEGGFIPDFQSRYFTADFPYGLSILVQIADLLVIEVPNMKQVLNWYYGLVDVKQEFRFERYQIFTKQDLVEFYSR